MSVTLRPIEEGDLEKIMRWRMDEEITRFMNTNPKLTLEGQKRWLSSIRANVDVRYWLILVDQTPAGVINLTGLKNPQGNLGWAYYMGEKKLRSLKTALCRDSPAVRHKGCNCATEHTPSAPQSASCPLCAWAHLLS